MKISSALISLIGLHLIIHTSSTESTMTNITDFDKSIISKLETEIEEYINASIADEFANMTDEEYLEEIRKFIFPKPWTWILIICHTAVFCVGIIGNVLVCAAVYRNYSMRTVTNNFIVNLAIADFMVIFICLPPTVIWDVTLTWFFGNYICKIVLYLQTVSVTVSVLTLTFISIDRWYAICFPLKFKSTTRRAKSAIILIWILALLLDVPELIVYAAVPHPAVLVETVYFTQCVPSWSKETDTIWTLVKLILLYFLPLIFMTVSYIQIIKVLWKSGNLVHRLGIGGNRYFNCTADSNVGTKGQLRSRKKAAKMLVCVVAMFALCYFPVHLLSMLRLLVDLDNSDKNRAFALISHWLCYANSAVNPLIYNFMNGKFRKEFRRFVNCCSGQSYRDVYEMNTTPGRNTLRRLRLTDTLSARTDSTKSTVDSVTVKLCRSCGVAHRPLQHVQNECRNGV